MIQVRWETPDQEDPVPTVPLHPAKLILREVARKHGLTVEQLLAPVRSRYIAHARQEAMWEMRQRTILSFPEIARRCGLKDHTTAIYGVRSHEARIARQAAA
jgi:chromosomal replication initiator protein